MVPQKKNIFLDILFTLLTAGLFNIYVQWRQVRDTNLIIKHDYYSFLWLVFLTIITFGLYLVYHEYKMTQTLHEAVYGERRFEVEVICGFATFLGLWFIVDSYQQHLINLRAH